MKTRRPRTAWRHGTASCPRCHSSPSYIHKVRILRIVYISLTHNHQTDRAANFTPAFSPFSVQALVPANLVRQVGAAARLRQVPSSSSGIPFLLSYLAICIRIWSNYRACTYILTSIFWEKKYWNIRVLYWVPPIENSSIRLYSLRFFLFVAG
jgi:hypothetical protein